MLRRHALTYIRPNKIQVEEIETDHSIFWLEGVTGAGKSIIARTIAQELAPKKQLGASFFFIRIGDTSRAEMVCTTVARKLAETQPSSKEWIARAVEDNYEIDGRTLLRRNSFHLWIRSRHPESVLKHLWWRIRAARQRH